MSARSERCMDKHAKQEYSSRPDLDVARRSHSTLPIVCLKSFDGRDLPKDQTWKDPLRFGS